MIKILKEQYMLCICGFGLVYMLYTIIKQTNFNDYKSKILTNQKQSKTNEPSYLTSWWLTYTEKSYFKSLIR